MSSRNSIENRSLDLEQRSANLPSAELDSYTDGAATHTVLVQICPAIYLRWSVAGEV